MEGLRVTANFFRGLDYHDHDGYSVTENDRYTTYITTTAPHPFGRNWMSSLTAFELEILTFELGPDYIDGPNMTIKDKEPGDVVNILKRYGFVVTSRRVEMDKLDLTMMKF